VKKMNSQHFREIRLSLGMTQKKLADLMGMRQHHISRIETGESAPTKIQAAFIRMIARDVSMVDSPEIFFSE
jgi:transcriptional regulator with XRE-family HTH domain